MLEMKPELNDKARKRRSSRTAGLTTKDPWANILLFRTVSDERYNIYDWQVMMKPQLTPESRADSPVNTPSHFNNFINPFAPRDARVPSTKPDIPPRSSERINSSYPHAPRDRPSAMISPSPSLRSRRSDLSSQASSQHPPIGFTSSHTPSYSSTLPPDLPSPASTSYEPQTSETWGAQGRTSALSSHSHTRASNSIASAIAPVFASTPPAPRETILDRAFQMRCIPGSERVVEQDEDKLSSLARFEALMREVDERKQQKPRVRQHGNIKETSEWDLDEESEDSDSAEPTINNEEESEEDDELELELSDEDVGIPQTAQRALEYIAGGRRATLSPKPRTFSPAREPPIPFLNPQAMSALHDGSTSPNGGLRPRTGTSTSYRNGSRPTSLIPNRSASAAEVPRQRDVSSNTSNSHLKTTTDAMEKRHSSTSVKRLSFQEFAKRLSSTSSLLLLQTNASSNSGIDGSRRTSSEFDPEHVGPSSERDKRCGWRGSVGAFGGDGGFL